jgi:hypothetical protein
MAVQLWMATNHHQEPAKEGREKIAQLAFVMTNSGCSCCHAKKEFWTWNLEQDAGFPDSRNHRYFPEM